MGGTPQAPTIQNAISDPNFWKLSVDDRVSVLSHIDSNFRGLKPETQLEVMRHLGERAGAPVTIGPQQEGFPVGASPSMPMAPSGSQTAAGIQGRENLRNALPYAGAAAASLLAGPEAGVAARMALAGLGGAAGSAAGHAIPGGTQPPLLSKEGAQQVGMDAATQAAYELGGALIGKLGRGIISRLTPKVPVEEAAAKLAETFAPQIEPSQFGGLLRDTISTTRATLGAQKQQVLQGIVQQFPNARLSLNATQTQLNQAISDLSAQQKLVPSLFAAGEKNARTLAVLNDLKDSIGAGKVNTIEQLDSLRSQLFQLGQGMDRSLPKGIINRLTHAVHDDIGATLGQFGAPGNAAFAQFENASGAFRDVADAMDTSVLKRVMNKNVNQPEKVFRILMQAPEGNLDTLGQILDKSPNGQLVKDQVKHLALEQAAASPQGLASIPTPAHDIIFGPDLPKIEKFFSLVQEPRGQLSMIQKAGVHVAGVIGGFAAGETVGHPLIGLGAGEAVANWFIHSGAETRAISSTELASLLGNPKARDLLLRAATTPATEKASALILRGLGAYLTRPEPAPTEQPAAAPTPTGAPVSGGATIGDQLRSKGISLPRQQPQVPQLPFHPGAGL